MKTVEFFKNYEDTDPSLRGDPHEGLFASYSPDDGIFELNGQILEGIIGKVDVWEAHHDQTNIFSMTMISDNDILGCGERGLTLSNKFTKFGNKAVFIGGKDISTFIKRLKKALNNNPNIYTLEQNNQVAKKITYLDRKNHHHNLSIFNKFNEFNWQFEWRISLKQIKGSGPFKLKIGDISDIAYVVETEKLVSEPIRLSYNKAISADAKSRAAE